MLVAGYKTCTDMNVRHPTQEYTTESNCSYVSKSTWAIWLPCASLSQQQCFGFLTALIMTYYLFPTVKVSTWPPNPNPNLTLTPPHIPMLPRGLLLSDHVATVAETEILLVVASSKFDPGSVTGSRSSPSFPNFSNRLRKKMRLTPYF